jgi:hypothetical protein
MRPLFPRFEVLERVGRNILAVGANFGQLAQRPPPIVKESGLDLVRSEHIDVPGRGPLTDWERQDIAKRVASELWRGWRRRSRVVDVEPLELETVAGDATVSEPVLKLRCESARHPRGPRKLAEPPTELTLRAQELLRKVGRTYTRTRMTSVVVEMIRVALAGELRATFELEKARLRNWLKGQLHTRCRKYSSEEKNKGVVPHPSTFNNNINSLEPIYQVLVADFHPEFVANSVTPIRES